MSEWIKCSERLPDDLTRVDILINKQRRIVDAQFTKGKFYAFPPITKDHWTEIKNNVTHWMLPPKPPSL